MYIHRNLLACWIDNFSGHEIHYLHIYGPIHCFIYLPNYWSNLAFFFLSLFGSRLCCYPTERAHPQLSLLQHGHLREVEGARDEENLFEHLEGVRGGEKGVIEGFFARIYDQQQSRAKDRRGIQYVNCLRMMV